MTEKENNWLYITIISSCCDQLPFLPDTTCVCQRHRRETTVPRGRLCPPPQLAWTNPPGKSNTHRELTHTHTHTHTSSTHSGITDMSHMVLSSNLIPESDLPGVPARNPRGEQSLHVAQEHHSVHAVVLTAGLLVKQRQPVIIFVTYKTKKGCDNFH